MQFLATFFIEKHYNEKLAKKDRLQEFNKIIDWERYRSIIQGIYDNKSTRGGRPNKDEVSMIKVLFLQSLYNLSDEELEYQINDRNSFKRFVGYENETPDFTTIWRFRERLAKHGLEELLWAELMGQLSRKDVEVKLGVIQDASIIQSPVGKKRANKEQKAKKEGREIRYTKRQKSQIDKNSTFTKKHNKTYHGHKLHIKVDMDEGFIQSYYVTTASVHDSQIDLVEPEDVRVARDKAYFGVPLKYPNIEDLTMKRASRNKPLTKEEKRINRLISRVRSPGERPFAIIKNVFHRDTTRYKRSHRVRVQQMFNCFTFNIYHLYHCSRRGVIA